MACLGCGLVRGLELGRNATPSRGVPDGFGSRGRGAALGAGGLLALAVALLAGCDGSSTVEPDADVAVAADVAATQDVAGEPDVAIEPDLTVEPEVAGEPDAPATPDVVPVGDAVSGPLALCDGPAMIFASTETGDTRELIPWKSGDVLIRGFCGADGDVDRFRIRATRGGPVNANLVWKKVSAELTLTISAPEVDGGVLVEPAEVGFKYGHMKLAELVDADGSGDYDIDIDVRCVSGPKTAWTVLLDTASTRQVEPAANGWPEDLRPKREWTCAGGNFPDLLGLLDQHGHNDITVGQYYGDMVLVVFSALWCGPCQLAASEAEQLHRNIESLSDEWGFSIMELLIDGPNPGYDATIKHAIQWEEAFNLATPVLTGPGVHSGDACLASNSIPTFAILDPHLKLRRLEKGYNATLLWAAVRDEFNAFRAENPEWVSPRCAGTEGAELLCPCMELLPGEPDADGDHISDACDFCPKGNDRTDFNLNGVPDACETP